MEQSSAVYCAWSLAVAGSVLADGEADGLDAAEPLPDGVGSAFSASVTARPCVLEVAEGGVEGDEDEVALSVALSLSVSLSEPVEALLEALGEGLAAGSPPETSVVRTGRK